MVKETCSVQELHGVRKNVPKHPDLEGCHLGVPQIEHQRQTQMLAVVFHFMEEAIIKHHTFTVHVFSALSAHRHLHACCNRSQKALGSVFVSCSILDINININININIKINIKININIKDLTFTAKKPQMARQPAMFSRQNVQRSEREIKKGRRRV